MYEPNVQRTLELIKPTDKVLDIGGWARPFNRANYVLDSGPYESRGYYGKSRPAQGGDTECFTAETWIQRDICEHTPFPFADKELDFVMCSHTLEDIRDPLWVCSEMVRVAKAGYLEIPSRMAESSRGVEPNQVGWTHHRWLIDIADNRVSFLMKFHNIHSHWSYSFPASYMRALSEEERVQWLYWNDGFDFEETTIHGLDEITAELAGYVQRIHPYPKWKLRGDQQLQRLARVKNKVARKVLPGRKS